MICSGWRVAEVCGLWCTVQLSGQKSWSIASDWRPEWGNCVWVSVILWHDLSVMWSWKGIWCAFVSALTLLHRIFLTELNLSYWMEIESSFRVKVKYLKVEFHTWQRSLIFLWSSTSIWMYIFFASERIQAILGHSDAQNLSIKLGRRVIKHSVEASTDISLLKGVNLVLQLWFV